VLHLLKQLNALHQDTVLQVQQTVVSSTNNQVKGKISKSCPKFDWFTHCFLQRVLRISDHLLSRFVGPFPILGITVATTCKLYDSALSTLKRSYHLHCHSCNEARSLCRVSVMLRISLPEYFAVISTRINEGTPLRQACN
jgi:hypothetical protein